MSEKTNFYLSIAAILTAIAVLVYALFGLAIPTVAAIIKGQLVTPTIGSWVVPTGSIVLIGLGAIITLKVGVNVVNSAQKAPFSWALPILTVFAGFVIDWCKELYGIKSDYVKAGISATLAAFFFLGGILWKLKNRAKSTKEKIFLNIASVLCVLMPPISIVSRYIIFIGNPLNNKEILSTNVIIPVVLYAATLMLTIILSYRNKESLE